MAQIQNSTFMSYFFSIVSFLVIVITHEKKLFKRYKTVNVAHITDWNIRANFLKRNDKKVQFTSLMYSVCST